MATKEVPDGVLPPDRIKHFEKEVAP